MAQREAHQQGNRPAGGAFLAAAAPGGAGDIEMRPALLAREAREKRRRRDTAGGTPADVGEVGEVRAQLLLIVLPERHLPDAVPGVVAGGAQLLGKLFIVGE